MRRFLALAAAAFAALAAPAAAHDWVVVEWVEVDAGASRFVIPEAASALQLAERRALAAYGPFRVLDDGTAALVDTTDHASPAAFAAMLRDYPGIATLRFHDCPGTRDDLANLRLGRMIRAAGLAVEVPEGGSVRSGAVELVLAGRSIAIADGAEFAVHGWIDEDGRGAEDYAPGSPEHRKYLTYYREMGLEDGQAARFYAMTNSVPFEQALWLGGAEMRDWIAAPAAIPQPPVTLAYLDLAALLN